jgi:hypothetical protein
MRMREPLASRRSNWLLLGLGYGLTAAVVAAIVWAWATL